MTNIKHITLSVVIAAAIAGCNSQSEKTVTKNDSTAAPEPVVTAPSATDVTGTYVAEGYQQRSEGYDWVGITVKQWGDKEILLSVRSRADKKKPTCTADIRAYWKDGNTYSAVAEGKNIVISFTADALTIATENKADEAALAFYCSGGATVAGTYKKISEPLDAAQADQTEFSKVLRLQDVGFTVSTIKKGDRKELSVYLFGPSVKDTKPHTLLFDGYAEDAEVEDLNADGSPELVVYTVSEGTGRFGNVFGFSVDKSGKMTRIEFPDVNDNVKLNKGYRGKDKFSLVERNLSQIFPVYNDSDPESQATGGTRQVVYKMVKSGNGFKFEISSTKDSQ